MVSFDGSPEKQKKVEARKKRLPDVEDPDQAEKDEEFCAGETCNTLTQHCVQMRGHEKEPNWKDGMWWTCCPKALPLAGKGGRCCQSVDGNGVCI